MREASQVHAARKEARTVARQARTSKLRLEAARWQFVKEFVRLSHVTVDSIRIDDQIMTLRRRSDGTVEMTFRPYAIQPANTEF